MRFLTEIRDHFQSFETHGFFVFELHTVCIDHRSDTVREVEEITTHVGFQMIAIRSGGSLQLVPLQGKLGVINPTCVTSLPVAKDGVGERRHLARARPADLGYTFGERLEAPGPPPRP
jgi:hypothetical protein